MRLEITEERQDGRRPAGSPAGPRLDGLVQTLQQGGVLVAQPGAFVGPLRGQLLDLLEEAGLLLAGKVAGELLRNGCFRARNQSKAPFGTSTRPGTNVTRSWDIDELMWDAQGTRRYRANGPGTPPHGPDGMWSRRVDELEVRRYLTLMKTRVSSKGQIVLPAEMRRQDRIEAGQEFEVERLDRGEYRLIRRSSPRNEGVVDWLLACPDKGFFVPVDSESTDSL